jgi:CPA2 family monovalent cation:H+ antiporter-2
MDALMETLRRRSSREAKDDSEDESLEKNIRTGQTDFKEEAMLINHIIVCGYGYYGQKIVEHLVDLNMPYVVVEFQRSLVDLARTRGHEVLFGNAGQKSILKKAGIRGALAVIISIEDEKKAILISQRIISIDPDINIVVKSSHRQAFDILKKYRNHYIINEHEELAKLLVHYAVTCELKLNE